jgi:uncharacterized Ntn-hydrolase superfamily protein
MPLKRIATFSIVAYDKGENAWGIAVSSKFPAVGAVVPWARAGEGAVATQSYANTTYGPLGLGLMASGVPAQEALTKLVNDDEKRKLRQAGFVDASGNAATFTGEDCMEWAGGLVGDGFCVQGNILTGPEVIEQMADAYRNSDQLEFPERLLNALSAGDRAGGDRRGRQSAAVLLVKQEGGYGGFNDRWVDYRVDDHENPIPQLADLLNLHRLYFGESEAEDKLEIKGETAQKMNEIMMKLGYLPSDISSVPDEDLQAALRKFIGNENFEDRTDFESGFIDRPVYEYLIKKYYD